MTVVSHTIFGNYTTTFECFRTTEENIANIYTTLILMGFCFLLVTTQFKLNEHHFKIHRNNRSIVMKLFALMVAHHSFAPLNNKTRTSGVAHGLFGR